MLEQARARDVRATKEDIDMAKPLTLSEVTQEPWFRELLTLAQAKGRYPKGLLADAAPARTIEQAAADVKNLRLSQ